MTNTDGYPEADPLSSTVLHSLSGVMEATSLADAASFMTTRDIGAAGVYSRDAKHLAGIITERDITRAVARRLDLDNTPVSAVMTTDLVIAEAPLSSGEARAQMKAAHIRHLIVRHNGGDHIVSLRDV